MSEAERLQAAILVLEEQRTRLGEAVVAPLLAAAYEKLQRLHHTLPPHPEQRRPMTILFADISGYTALAESWDAEEVQDLLGRFWAPLDTILFEHGAVLDKHLGDGVLAVWGLQQAREDDPIQAVRAALALQRHLAEWRQRHAVALTMRVGLNSGLVSVATLPTTGERNLVGDAVNLAARLEKAAPVHGVLISHATYLHVRDRFEVIHQPPLHLKGKQESVQSYLVQRERQLSFSAFSDQAPRTSRQSPTVGRAREMQCLEDSYQEVCQQRHCCWLTITGEAGVGKSRLLADFEQGLQASPTPPLFLRARAWPHTQRTPYFLLRELWVAHFEVDETASTEAVLDRLEQGLTATLAGASTEAAALISHLLGFDMSQSRWIAPIQHSPRQIRARAIAWLRSYLTSLAHRHPTVLLLEDLHWADQESLAGLDELLGPLTQSPLLVVGVTRLPFGQQRPGWGKDARGQPLPHHRELALSPLDQAAATALVRSLLPHPVPETLVERLVERGEGNPYFTEELTRWLIERGVLPAHNQDAVDTGRLAAQPLPGTIEQVLQARLEEMSPAERVPLQWAAVVGRTFWESAVAYIGQREVGPGAWATLQARGLLMRPANSQLPGEVERQFKHALLRDVVYEYTLKKERRRYHRRAAEWWEQVGSTPWAAVIASHYEQGGETARAALWYGRAAQQALQGYAPLRAIEFFQRALALQDPTRTALATQLSWYEGLGEALVDQARYEEAAACYTTMGRLARRAGARLALARARIHQAEVAEEQGRYRTALSHAAQGARWARRAGAPGQRTLAVGLYRQGWALRRLGESQAASAIAAQILRLGQALGSELESGYGWNLLGSVNRFAGRYEQAHRCFSQALTLFRTVGDQERIAIVLSNLAEIQRLCGEYALAIPLYEDALSIARLIGDRGLENLIRNNLNGARVGLGGDACTLAERDLRALLAETAPDWGIRSESYRFLAEALLAQHKLGEALEIARQALAQAAGVEQPEYIGAAWRVLGQIVAARDAPLLLEGIPYDAPACFARSLAIFVQAGSEGQQARTQREWAHYQLARGEWDEGVARWHSAHASFERLGLRALAAAMQEPLPRGSVGSVTTPNN